MDDHESGPTTAGSADEPLTPADVSAMVAVCSRDGHTGVATMDLVTQRLVLYQFVDDDVCGKLRELMHRMTPKRCLIPNTAGDETRSLLIRFTNDAEVILMDRDKFCDLSGRDFVLRYCSGGEHMLMTDVSDRDYALAAAGALFRYVCDSGPHPELASLTLDVLSADKCMIMDMETVRSLELFHTQNGNNKDGLFSFLNRTRTVPGRCRLRQELFSPSTDVSELIGRQDAVQELIENQQLFDELADFFGHLQVDLGNVINKLKKNPRQQTSALLDHQIESVVCLKHVLALLPALATHMAQCRSDLLKRTAVILNHPVYQSLLLEVNRYIVDECILHQGALNFKLHKVFALRSDVNPDLAVQRTVYLETLQKMDEITVQMDKNFGFEGTLRLACNVSRGYHFEMPLNRVADSPVDPVFVNCTSDQKVMRCTTADIMHFDRLLSNNMQNIVTLSHETLQNLIAYIRNLNDMSDMYHLNDAIAYLDFLMSLAIVAKENDLKRPIFSDQIKMRNSANPLFAHLAKRSPGREAVTNDIQITKFSPLMLVTGPNMSGKSGFLRQVALLQVMAQIGSFLPATDNPQVRIVRRILTRIGCDEDLVTSSSTFMTEANQVNYVLRKVTADSLVIIDELGRGTSDEEGVALCASACEFLMQKKAFGLFATHFQDLVRLHHLYPFVNSFRMDYSVKKNPDGCESPHFLYKLKRWSSDDEESSASSCSSGIQIAEKLSREPDWTNKSKHLLPQVEVYRNELAIHTTDLKRRMLLALQLNEMARQPNLKVDLQLGEYLNQLNDIVAKK